jgi:DNA-binding protein
VKAGEKAPPQRSKLGVRIPACGFSLRVVARRLRKSFIVKWRVRNIKIDTEKIETQRALEIRADGIVEPSA